MTMKATPKKAKLADEEFESLAQAAEKSGLTPGAMSHRLKRHGTIEPKMTPTMELLLSGRLGKKYLSASQARADLKMDATWVNVLSRLDRGYPVDIAVDNAKSAEYKKQLKKERGLKFKEPIIVEGVEYQYYGDIKKAYPDLELASAQVIRRNAKAGKKDLDIIISRKHLAKTKK